MAIRFDDRERNLSLSVLDLVDLGAASGHLVLEVGIAGPARMAAGREVHLAWQAAQVEADAAYEAEVRVRHQVAVGAWTVTIHGRVDGLAREGDRVVVEEIKSTALPADALFATTPADWPKYVAQLEAYQWILSAARHGEVAGRLVLVSLVDGARHLLGVELNRERTERVILRALLQLVDRREERLAWLEARRGRKVPTPFDDWRPGQQEIADTVESALDEGRPLLAEAPTGHGKTGAAMYGVLRHVLARDRQVFWATSRTTQQIVAETTARRFVERGLPLRVVTLSAKDKVCLNDVIACRPDACPYAWAYYDKLHDGKVVAEVLARGADRTAMLDAGRAHEVCPYQLAVDASDTADIVIGDYNYAFDPAVRKAGITARPEEWVVVVDEAHQLVERARGYASPRVQAASARAAIARMEEVDGVAWSPFVDVAADVLHLVEEAWLQVDGPSRDSEGVAELSPRPWLDLADRVDELAIDFLRVKARAPLAEASADDPWLRVARQVSRFAPALYRRDDATVAIVSRKRSAEAVSLLCLDPSPWMGPWIRQLGGFVGMSATLRPTAFHRDLLGLDAERLVVLEIDPFFPRENLAVVVAPRVSTAYRHRRTHAAATAALMQRCIEAVPGNVAAYFPSFAMLDDISGRWDIERDLLLQRPGMAEDERAAWLETLGSGRPVVLAAVLGGIFAEGIDLPPGALSAVLVAGPALPPVGLERDLLRDWYDVRYDGEGFRYASLVPGMTKVVQAAGRLLRRPEDRGVVVLVGRRFRWREYAALLPGYWSPTIADDPAAAAAAFWGGQ